MNTTQFESVVSLSNTLKSRFSESRVSIDFGTRETGETVDIECPIGNGDITALDSAVLEVAPFNEHFECFDAGTNIENRVATQRTLTYRPRP